MINFDNAMENNTTHNLNWLYIAERPYRILIIRGAELGKANAILNLINHEPDTDKIYFCGKDLYEAKYQL